MAVRPVDDDLVGHREPLARREDLARVAHGHVVPEDLGDTGERGREVDCPEDHHARWWRERLDERGDGSFPCFPVLAVVANARDAGRQLAHRVANDDSVEVGVADGAERRTVFFDQQLRSAVRSFDDGHERDRLPESQRLRQSLVDHALLTTAASSSSAASECPSTKSSTYGSAAAMPRASGA